MYENISVHSNNSLLDDLIEACKNTDEGIYCNISKKVWNEFLRDFSTSDTKNNTAEYVPLNSKVKKTIEPSTDYKNSKIAIMNWDELITFTQKCNACGFAKYRKKIVFGEGNQNAELFIIGEHPTLEENLYGHPFMGHHGKKLDGMLSVIGIPRKETYLTYLLKCKPHNALISENSIIPRDSHISVCIDILKRQIELVNPYIILILGTTAAQMLFNQEFAVLKGKEISFMNKKTFITYSPGYFLRDKSMVNIARKEAMETLKLIKHLLKIHFEK